MYAFITNKINQIFDFLNVFLLIIPEKSHKSFDPYKCNSFSFLGRYETRGLSKIPFIFSQQLSSSYKIEVRIQLVCYKLFLPENGRKFTIDFKIRRNTNLSEISRPSCLNIDIQEQLEISWCTCSYNSLGGGALG